MEKDEMLSFNDKFSLKTLEFDKILLKLAEKTACEDAYTQALSLAPKNSKEQVLKAIDETFSAYDLQNRFGSPKFHGLVNVDEMLKLAKNGGSLLPSDLLKIATVLRVFINLLSWRKHNSEFRSKIDYLFKKLYENKYLAQKIMNCIISDDEISDTASLELSNIRRKIKTLSSRIRDKLDKIIHSTTYQKYLQEPIVTMRDNRYVVPVKAEYRAFVNGFVHDTSASGMTLFIEPVSVLEMNNDIKVLKSKEKTEINRILSELSLEVAQVADSISDSYHIAIDLNIIFAKSDLAYEMRAGVPKISNNMSICLKKARHPLIAKDKVVPIDISLNDSTDTLVITGPNTGGKTVCLKTVGLLTVMAMSGMMIPVGDGSEIGVFENIFCDIGDEQSIEQSLSTFSSHITNIIKIQKYADSKSLVLLDELGAGTDPVEGAAIAISVIENLREKGAKILATTHYPELKSFALNTERVENASCEFNVKTLKPTYKLIIGIPGKSNAFAICKHLAMPENIIDRAKELISNENRSFENVIAALEETKQKLEGERRKTQKLYADAQKEKEVVLQSKKHMKKEYEDELKKAREKAQRIVSSAQASADELFRQIEELKKDKENITDAQRSKLKSDLKKLQDKADPIEKKKLTNYKLPRKLKKGDSVLIVDLDKNAVVLELPNSDGKVLVKAGIIKTRVPISNLKLMENNTEKKAIQKITKNIKSKSAYTEIDLRGKNALEAVAELDMFMDSVILSGLKNFTVIHGKGEGILRKEIGNFLRKNKYVKTFRLGVFGEGESGVTIVELK